MRGIRESHIPAGEFMDSSDMWSSKMEEDYKCVCVCEGSLLRILKSEPERFPCCHLSDEKCLKAVGKTVRFNTIKHFSYWIHKRKWG